MLDKKKELSNYRYQTTLEKLETLETLEDC